MCALCDRLLLLWGGLPASRSSRLCFITARSYRVPRPRPTQQFTIHQNADLPGRRVTGWAARRARRRGGGGGDNDGTRSGGRPRAAQAKYPRARDTDTHPPAPRGALSYHLTAPSAHPSLAPPPPTRHTKTSPDSRGRASRHLSSRAQGDARGVRSTTARRCDGGKRVNRGALPGTAQRGRVRRGDRPVIT